MTNEYAPAIVASMNGIIAELEAENARLMNECDEWTNRCRAAVVAFDEQKARAEFVEAEALSRTGAVKVKALEWDKGVVDCARPLPGMRYNACGTTPAGSWVWWLDDTPGTRAVLASEAEAKAAAQADFERRILSALEDHPRAATPVEDHETANVSDKPEGQQEPVAWMIDRETCPEYHGHIPSYIPKSERTPEYGVYPLYTRPSEQAVTEEAVDAAERTMAAHYERPLKAWELTALHEALKAAMEAGG